MSASDLRWLSQEYTLRELLEDYEDALPQIAVVRGGYCGINNQHSFSTGERFFIHGTQSQHRLVARDSAGRQYSIPRCIAKTLKITKHGKTYKKSIRSIMEDWQTDKHSGVYKVHFTSNVPVSYCHDDDVTKVVKFDELQLVDHYKEKYLVSSCIIGNGSLHSQLVAIPVYINIRLSFGADRNILRHFRIQTQNLDLRECKLNKEIIVIPSIVDLNDENPYMYLQPESVLSSCGTPQDPKYAQLLIQPTSTLRSSPSTNPQKRSTAGIQENVYATIPSVHPQQSTAIPERHHLDHLQDYKLDHRQNHNQNHLQDLQRLSANRNWLTVVEMSTALHALNLGRHIPKFQSHAIDGNMLKDLNAEMLREEFGFNSFETMKLMKFANGWTPQLHL